MKRELTCIICPVGCNLTVDVDEKTVLEVTGNACPRGARYAENECIAPERTVTTTIRTENGKLLPVKTNKPIPKEKVMACMKIINSSIARLPISTLDVIIKDVFGADVVATKSMGVDASE